MINPGPNDIGRRVIYVPGHAHGSQAHPDCEQGVITSFNPKYVFVRYGDQPNPKATLREDLHFVGPPA